MFSVKYYTEKLTDNSAVSESMEKKEEEIKNVNALCVKVCRVQKLRQSSSYHASYLGSFPLAASYNHTTTDISQCSHTSGESLTDSAKMSGRLCARTFTSLFLYGNFTGAANKQKRKQTSSIKNQTTTAATTTETNQNEYTKQSSNEKVKLVRILADFKMSHYTPLLHK